MNISNNFITHNSVQLKQNQQNSRALSFKSETKKDEVNLKSDDSEELIKPNKYITMLSYMVATTTIGSSLIEKVKPGATFAFIAIGALIGDIMIKQTEINDRLKKLESKNK